MSLRLNDPSFVLANVSDFEFEPRVHDSPTTTVRVTGWEHSAGNIKLSPPLEEPKPRREAPTLRLRRPFAPHRHRLPRTTLKMPAASIQKQVVVRKGSCHKRGELSDCLSLSTCLMKTGDPVASTVRNQRKTPDQPRSIAKLRALGPRAEQFLFPHQPNISIWRYLCN